MSRALGSRQPSRCQVAAFPSELFPVRADGMRHALYLFRCGTLLEAWILVDSITPSKAQAQVRAQCNTDPAPPPAASVTADYANQSSGLAFPSRPYFEVSTLGADGYLGTPNGGLRYERQSRPARASGGQRRRCADGWPRTGLGDQRGGRNQASASGKERRRGWLHELHRNCASARRGRLRGDKPARFRTFRGLGGWRERIAFKPGHALTTLREFVHEEAQQRLGVPQELTRSC